MAMILRAITVAPRKHDPARLEEIMHDDPSSLADCGLADTTAQARLKAEVRCAHRLFVALYRKCPRTTSNPEERRTPARRSAPSAIRALQSYWRLSPGGRVVNIGFELCRPPFQAALPSSQPGGNRSRVVVG